MHKLVNMSKPIHCRVGDKSLPKRTSSDQVECTIGNSGYNARPTRAKKAVEYFLSSGSRFALSSNFLNPKGIFVVGFLRKPDSPRKAGNNLLTVDFSKLVMFFCGPSIARRVIAKMNPPIHFLASPCS